MDLVMLSRWQFAITTIYHFFFVPLTLGLGWIVAVLETIFVRTGNETYKRMAMFWGKLFIINFTMGVVTGIVQEFQFGMNWSEYSRYVGDIFGVPLAIEALLAFFLESTFLGVWVFGWDRLSRKIHLSAIWLVAIASNLSALWILIANAWMQHPVGYVIHEGRAEMTSFTALVSNPKAWLFFGHTVASGLATAAFFILGISAYHLLRKKEIELFNRSFHLAAMVALIASLLVGVIGHEQGLNLIENQPMKIAAAESLWETEDPASFSILTIFDWSGREEAWSLRVPYLLSLITYFRPSGEVMGILPLQQEYEALYGPGDYIPNVGLVYWGFRLMFISGVLMVGLGALAVLYSWRKKAIIKARWIKLYLVAMLLPYAANTGGWLMTETGRQPFIVYGLLRTEQAVSPNLDAMTVLMSLAGFSLIYAALMIVDIYLLGRFARAGVRAAESGMTPDPSLDHLRD